MRIRSRPEISLVRSNLLSSRGAAAATVDVAHPCTVVNNLATKLNVDLGKMSSVKKAAGQANGSRPNENGLYLTAGSQTPKY